MLSPTLRSLASFCTLAACLALAMAPVSVADPLPAGPKPPLTLPKRVDKEVELETEIDLIKLLNRNLVMPDFASQTDTIWQIDSSEGRRVVRIPLKVTKPDSETLISGSTVKVRGGRFICWHLLDPKEEVTGKVDTLASGATISATGDDRLPLGVPRMAKTIRLMPDGTLHWKMERFLVGARVIDSIPGAYNMKLSPAAIEKLDPGAAPRVLKNAGEKQADYLKRKQPIEEDYKKKMALYRETRLQLAKLPDEFSGPLPPTLWAVYETRGNAKAIEFDGSSPLPWEFPFDLLMQLQRVVASRADGGGGETSQPLGTPGATFNNSPVETELLKVLTGENVHPYTTRLVAHAITLSPFLSTMEEGDLRYQIAAKVLEGKDTIATSEMMKYLAVRPSKASASLMKKALEAGLLDAKAQLSSVVGMVATLGKDPNASVESALQTINRYLADPKGPPAAQVLEPLFALAKDKANLIGPISKGIRVDATGPRRDEIIVSLLKAAVTDPVAMSIVDSRLLGADDPSLTERTLYLISRAVKPKVTLELADADGKPIAMAPAGAPAPKLIALTFWSTASRDIAGQIAAINLLQESHGSRGISFVGINLDTEKARFENAVKEWKPTWPQAWDGKALDGAAARKLAVLETPTAILLAGDGQLLWRGRAAALEKAILQQLQSSGDSPALTPGGNDPMPELVSDIGIVDLQHNIFRLLSNAKFRNLAWGALRQMRMTAPAVNASADRAKWPSTIVDLAVGQSPTPAAAVAFLVKHEEAGVPEALTQLVIRADADASSAAARALFGSGWPMDQVLTKLASESDRHAFGLRFYENIAREAPYSVGLLRDKADGSTALTWFGNQISAGHLPLPAQWIRPYQVEDRLLLLVNLNDEQLAFGAIGTLVAIAGGTGADTATVGAKLRANKTATHPELTKQWAAIRTELFTNKLKVASTTYVMSMRVGIASRTGEVAWGPSEKLDDVAMKIEGPKVTMNTAVASIPADESLSIALPPAQLKLLDTTPAAPLAALKATNGDKPIAFGPMAKTGWLAEFALPDGRRLELTLEAKN